VLRPTNTGADDAVSCSYGNLIENRIQYHQSWTLGRLPPKSQYRVNGIKAKCEGTRVMPRWLIRPVQFVCIVGVGISVSWRATNPRQAMLAGVLFLTGVLAVNFVERARRPYWRSASPYDVMRLPYSHGVGGAAGAMLSAVMAILLQCFSDVGTHRLPADARVEFTLAVLIPGALCLSLSAMYFTQRAAIQPDRLDYRTLLGWREVPWAEIAHVGYGRFIGGVVLRTIGGRTAGVNAAMVNMPGFARMVLRHVPAERIDARAFALLESAASA
jgi:Bacterial PH domain